MSGFESATTAAYLPGEDAGPRALAVPGTKAVTSSLFAYSSQSRPTANITHQPDHDDCNHLNCTAVAATPYQLKAEANRDLGT
jgi:hypothetical protein